LLERERVEMNRPDAAAHVLIMPRGLVAAVLASLPLSFGVVSNEVGSIILGTTVLVILLSTSLASLGAYAIHAYYKGASGAFDARKTRVR